MRNPRLPRPGRYILRPEPRRRPLARTCTAPTLMTIAPLVRGIVWADDIDAEELRGSLGCRIACRSMPPRETCTAPLPPGCQGTDWPPLTSWERYAAERREGVRVPPSVSTWRLQDVRRQAAVEREARGQAPEQPRVVAWGPSCEDERPAHRIGVRS